MATNPNRLGQESQLHDSKEEYEKLGIALIRCIACQFDALWCQLQTCGGWHAQIEKHFIFTITCMKIMSSPLHVWGIWPRSERSGSCYAKSNIIENRNEALLILCGERFCSEKNVPTWEHGLNERTYSVHIDSTHGNYRMVLWLFGQSRCLNIKLICQGKNKPLNVSTAFGSWISCYCLSRTTQW